MTEDFETTIWNDSYQTKQHLWEAYNGFVGHYNEYMMYRSLRKNNPLNVAGMVRYANYFYEECEAFLDVFKSKLGEDKISQIRFLFDNKDEYEHQDFILMRRFFNQFMFKCGIKNIFTTIDKRDPLTKLYERNGLNAKGVSDEEA